MTETALQRNPTGMELLDRLSRQTSDPAAMVEIAKQIVALQVQQEQLRQAQERFEWEKLDREARVAYAEAIQKFKEDAPRLLRTKHVKIEKRDGTKGPEYWHVELDKACDLLIPALLKQNITHRWKSIDLPGGFVRVTCYLRHRLGHEEEGASLAGPADSSGGKNPIQGVGSSNTYLERYTLLSTLGLVPEGKDNDGNPPGMTQEQGEEFIRAMQEAATASDVMGIWTKAINAAKGLDPIDYRAMTVFTEARDAKLKELKKGAK